jgi:ASCH domain.
MTMHWSDRYPHDLHASAILKNGKIKRWKVGNGKLSNKYNIDLLMPDYSYQEKTWTVNNFLESQDVFNRHSPDWFRQWPHADDYIGFPAYSTLMKAITIWQPWATLLALGEKEYETRSRRTNHRGKIAIHAGLQIDRAACEREPIKSTLAKHGYTVDNLPTGAVVGIADLVECWAVGEVYNSGVTALFNGVDGSMRDVNSTEWEFGDYSIGRYAYQMKDVKRLEKPLPAKGQQGLWNWEGGFI